MGPALPSSSWMSIWIFSSEDIFPQWGYLFSSVNILIQWWGYLESVVTVQSARSHPVSLYSPSSGWRSISQVPMRAQLSSSRPLKFSLSRAPTMCSDNVIWHNAMLGGVTRLRAQEWRHKSARSPIAAQRHKHWTRAQLHKGTEQLGDNWMEGWVRLQFQKCRTKNWVCGRRYAPQASVLKTCLGFLVQAAGQICAA